MKSDELRRLHESASKGNIGAIVQLDFWLHEHAADFVTLIDAVEEATFETDIDEAKRGLSVALKPFTEKT
tara:strand:- start:938 stop:1147 length:210 start_codon:yes stop_codon:yes gene_type:complete